MIWWTQEVSRFMCVGDLKKGSLSYTKTTKRLLKTKSCFISSGCNFIRLLDAFCNSNILFWPDIIVDLIRKVWSVPSAYMRDKEFLFLCDELSDSHGHVSMSSYRGDHNIEEAFSFCLFCFFFNNSNTPNCCQRRIKNLDQTIVCLVLISRSSKIAVSEMLHEKMYQYHNFM